MTKSQAQQFEAMQQVVYLDTPPTDWTLLFNSTVRVEHD